VTTGPHAAARWWTLAAGTSLAVIGWLADGGDAAAGAVFGTAAVVLFLSSGVLAFRFLGREDVPGGLGLVVYMLSYALRLAVVLMAVVLIGRVDWVDGRWLGGAIMVCALVWITAHGLHAWRRSKTELTIEPDSGSEGR
jgi:multisubunit Na+/H+ antiporter MnhB subunit